MKLDRNTTPDGRGKYALIQMRELTEHQVGQLRDAIRGRRGEAGHLEPIPSVQLPTAAIRLGGEPRDQFFVLKYKDRFASFALKAYADAVAGYAMTELPPGAERQDLLEFAVEVERESVVASSVGTEVPK